MAKDRGFGAIVPNDGGGSGNIEDGNIFGGIVATDPTTIDNTGNVGSDGNSAGTPKRRGRKPGTTNKATQNKVDINAVEGLLYNVHGMLSMIVKTPEVAITQEEAAHLAKAIANVNEHYDTRINAKTMAWINLGMASAAIYGPRVVVLINKRKPKAQSQTQQPPSPFQVVQ